MNNPNVINTLLEENRRLQDALLYRKDSISLDSLKEFMKASNQLPGYTTLLLYKQLLTLKYEDASKALEEFVRSTMYSSNEKLFDAHESLTKELLDLLVVILALLETNGTDTVNAYNAVMKSNLSKRNQDGYIESDKHGKHIKPDTYLPVNLKPYL